MRNDARGAAAPPATDTQAAQTGRASGWRALAVAVQILLLLVIAAGVAARIAALPGYVPDSGDEWGNTIAPFRVLFERGDPGIFLHPSLFYYLTALSYAAVFWTVKGLGNGPLSMTDLFVLDERYFVFAARGVSVLSAGLAMWALYALGRSLWDRTAGLMAAALLAVLPLHAVYSDAVRVDSLFLALFVYACACITRIVTVPQRATYDRAGFVSGLAAGANYNGAILIVWLLAAHLLRTTPPVDRQSDAPGDPSRSRWLPRALGLAGLGFVLSTPYALLEPVAFLHTLSFVSGLSLAAHPGSEGRDALFYAADLARTDAWLAGAIAVASLVIAAIGTRSERFVLSLAVGYFLLFSLLRTKYDRFILPALTLFLLLASGLPSVLARRVATRRMIVGATYAAWYALLGACIVSLAARSIPIPRHEMLARPDAVLLEWIEHNVPPRSTILVESGIAPLIDTLNEPGRFGTELRRSIVTLRPRLDQQFLGAVYIGGRSNYEPDMLRTRHIDYAIISPRNLRYVESRCEAFPAVCAFYRELRANGRVVYETSGGVELALIYEVRPR